MIDAQRSRRGRRSYAASGFSTLKKAVRILGGRAIDKRTSIGRALEDWRHSLFGDLGGIESISTQPRQIVDLAVKTKFILDSIDAYLLRQPSLVNHRRRAVLPVVLQRQQLADALSRYMMQIGLEQRAKPVQPLEVYLKEKYGKKDEVVVGTSVQEQASPSSTDPPS